MCHGDKETAIYISDFGGTARGMKPGFDRDRCRGEVSSRGESFPQRSPPRLFTDAACGGLKPPPAGRLRRTYLHLLHIIAAGFFIYSMNPPLAFVFAPEATIYIQRWVSR
jgi:hypothetical protein